MAPATWPEDDIAVAVKDDSGKTFAISEALHDHGANPALRAGPARRNIPTMKACRC